MAAAVTVVPVVPVVPPAYLGIPQTAVAAAAAVWVVEVQGAVQHNTLWRAWMEEQGAEEGALPGLEVVLAQLEVLYPLQAG